MFLDWKDTVKMSTQPKVIYRFNAVLIKIPLAFLTKKQNHTKNPVLKFVWNHNRP